VARGGDPYQVLGVDKTTGTADLKKAYREKAKSAHPDKGGTEEEMALVNWAYDLLTDPAARGHYDRTGKEQNSANLETEAGKALLGLFSSVVDKIKEECPGGVTSAPLLKEMRSQVAAKMEAMEAAMAEAEKEKVYWSRAKGRLSYSGKEQNLLELVFQDKIRQAESVIAECERSLKIGVIMKKLLKGYSWRKDTASAVAQYFFNAGPASYGSSTTAGGF